ncbi:MAG TPA: ABC transporter ATP-binding protein [Verrucomicrobiae bacterium]|nr:ABC transporter ATP-binding protein [Verrucomicrobiae bacterium]
MSDTAIKIENLGKRYRYGGVAPLSDSLRADIMDWAKGLLRLREEKGPTGAPHHESFRQIQAHRLDADPNYFWALRDVNLEIKQGEVVGIIGRNGAGKSTLLKILSRITPPTTGAITYHGRVASLLEVGTGFHRELTGRENIFLNGSILSMKRAEITKRFDEIVAFAEIDKFIDTPVKFYSSGMYVRLAFAVAAHLEPEILIVDEVLAVGDAAFQKKCLGKMGEVAKGGRTVVFVSHNMAAILGLCQRVVSLENGMLTKDGPTQDVVEFYLSKDGKKGQNQLAQRKDRTGSGRLQFTSVRLCTESGEVDTVKSGEDLTVELYFEAPEPIFPRSARLGISLVTATGVELVSFDSASGSFEPQCLPIRGVFRCHIPHFPLVRGTYQGWLYAAINGEAADRVEDAFSIRVISGEYPKMGYLALDHQWRVADNPSSVP